MRFGTSMSNPTGLRQTEQKDPFQCTDEQAAKCVTYDSATPNIHLHMALLMDSDHVQTTGVEGKSPKMTIPVDMTTSAMAKGVSDDVNSTDCLEVTQTTTAGPEGGAEKPGLSNPQAPSFGVLRRQSCNYCRKRKLMCNATVCSWEVRNTPQTRNRRRCDSCRRSKQRCDVTETTGCTQCILRSLRCTMTDSQKPTKPDRLVELADEEGSARHVRCPGNIHNLGPGSRKFSVEALGVPVEGLPAQLLPPNPNGHYPQPTPEPRVTATTGSESSDHPRMGALRSEEESACTSSSLLKCNV
ncbi:hypothetical protein BR93DRAFT_969635 [Coniochaeta sp. PMI_546]|nr:hypothetical protein BR93DRAFT_969635 [Coniochaeta sp. PMI_546]